MKRNNSGQAALIILAVMAIALTLGLSLSQRVIVDLEMTQDEEKSAQAFLAAEGGIEEALRILDEGGTIDDDFGTAIAGDLGVETVDIQVTTVGGQSEFLYPLTVKPGGWAFIWLCEHDEDGFNTNNCYGGTTIEVCWEDESSVEVMLFYEDGGYDFSRSAFNSPNSPVRESGNGFTNIDGVSDCLDLGVSSTVNISGTPLFMAVRSFYNQTSIGVSAVGDGVVIPTQGEQIVSTGQVQRAEEEVISRRIRAFRSYGMPPEFLFHSVISESGVTTE